MTTRFISFNELRQNISAFAGKRSNKKKQRLILQSKNEFFFELRPLTKKEIAMEKFAREIEEAEEDVKAGRVYSIEEVEKRLNMKV